MGTAHWAATGELLHLKSHNKSVDKHRYRSPIYSRSGMGDNSIRFDISKPIYVFIKMNQFNVWNF